MAEQGEDGALLDAQGFLWRDSIALLARAGCRQRCDTTGVGELEPEHLLYARVLGRE